MNELRLNIGAGHTYIPGFTNVDVSDQAEIQVDLGRESLPFETDSVDLVFSYHTLEHIDDYLFALGEIHRVLRNGGRFLLGVPYVTLTEYNLINPYHRQNFNEYSFDFFNPARLKGTAAEKNPILFRKIFHKEPEEAVRLMMEVHQTGCALATVTNLERAELYVEQVRSLARPRGFPLQATMEKA